jgi:hypothetical protein
LRRNRALAAAVIVAGALIGCDKTASPGKKPASAGSVKIVALSPETTTALKIGDKVKIQVEVSYRLAAEAGMVSLVVQSADNKNLAHNGEVVKKGTGKASISVEFVVPDTQTVQVFTPLQAQGQSATTTVAFRAYKVVAR